MKRIFGNLWVGKEMPTDQIFDAYRMAFEGASDHMIITDLDGKIIYANAAVEKITGYKPEEVIGKRPSVWGKQMPLQFYQQFWRVIKEEKRTFFGELTNKRKSGELYKAETRVTPILNTQGEIVFFLGIERDVTKEREIERVKTEFISLASHQLRTPLSAMKWFLSMYINKDFGDYTEKQAEVLSNLEQANERMIRLVNSLLNVSRIEAGKVTVEPEMVDSKKIVDDVLLELTAALVNKQVRVKKDFDPEVEQVKTDAKFLQEVIKGLVSNAITYSQVGGEIEVRIVKDSTSTMFEVIDHGVGIPIDEQGRVFTRFYRGSNVGPLDTEGSGLSLYVAKQLVEIMGGVIGFESKAGQGSRFWFTLPQAKEELAEPQVNLT